ncbi:MAG: tRNA pseudouridine(55) synthase TruB [Phycisphaeraceae bacterium]|jgi:tRNA pseudouridine55 synthase|nr:tRNA pseudouridine(55) synthase TruB [Phycisphaeraceae bacterium]
MTAAATSPSGLLVIDKPLGRTSMDVCRVVRRRLVAGGAPKRVKVGHGGTLDPLATGVLVVLVGKATRLCEQVMQGQKVYHTHIDLSAFSTTDDNEGEKTAVGVLHPPALADIRAGLEKLTGDIQQTPPVYSAVKVGGRRAYALARGGQAVRLGPRHVRVDSIEIASYEWPRLEIVVTSGKGVYIRSIARDLGRLLGTGGYLTGLRRTRIGLWDIQESRQLAGLPEQMGQGDLQAVG